MTNEISTAEQYAIYSPSEEGFWSNEDGWGSLDICTKFLKNEVNKYSRRRNRGELKRPRIMSAGDDAEWIRVCPWHLTNPNRVIG